MPLQNSLTANSATPVPPLSSDNIPAQSGASDYFVIRRNGIRTPFDKNKIVVAITKAFLATEEANGDDSSRIHQLVAQLSEQITAGLFRSHGNNGTVHIEDIQDQVELALMRSGEHKVARAYVLYRARHAEQRDEVASQSDDGVKPLQIVYADGSSSALNLEQLKRRIVEASQDLNEVDPEQIFEDLQRSLFDGMRDEDLRTALVMSARTRIDQEPEYSYLAARLLLDNMRSEALSFVHNRMESPNVGEMAECYRDYFTAYINRAVELELLDPELSRYDLKKMTKAIKPERDLQFTYLGLQTLYDRYFIHSGQIRIELPQAFFMRVAMGLAINEIDREARAIEFYQLLSSFDFMCSTPTLFNSGTPRPQLSSCYLTTVPDDLAGIYDAVKDNALLSKYAGGLGNDWTSVRGLGAAIKGTNGVSQGVVPFLKVANDTAVAVNQGGKRKGAVCAYLETWHIDIEEFLELRKNTGDERRRTHDMNSANWVPDLFMKRVAEQGDWTLFSPEEVPTLHELCGAEFDRAYVEFEQRASRGEMRLYKTVKAEELWRKMLGMLFETGHPWIAFKDPCNIRYTNQHVGVVHSSNLCTEITLHTSADEIAVCNLGSVNLPAHVDENGLDQAKLQRTISTAMRMLDNVIDYNFYNVPQARNSNLRHRPVGLGIMGFQDCLYKLGIAYSSEEAVSFADQSMEMVSYQAISASCDLAQERGRYSSYQGSLWSQGVLPIDSLQRLADQRGDYLQVDQTETLDWQSLRNRIDLHGMRNSNCLAIAPTATISNICGVSQSIEPIYQNLYVKSNLSGEFTTVNPYLVDDLKKLGLWDAVMVSDLKYFDGSVASIERVPADIKALYATAFEIDSRWLIEAGSRRQKWLDQAQSLNLYMAEPSGVKLDNLYKLAWVRGLKTTYYLRSLGATHLEKTTANQPSETQSEPQVCSILDPDCEACQ
ncbi:MAG: ribonucleoside-diphosphate reductase subunit alpha [Pseudomonadales bacterium]|nr:ribonucleoside-diphosphate reductase subunit alpha [Pseudomonadales bacterium]